jgi:hypothetical protein
MTRIHTAGSDDSPMARQGAPAAPADSRAAAGAAGDGKQADSAQAAAPARRARTAKPGAAAQPAQPAADGEDTRREMIAVAAYYRAERRGFVDGLADDDWFEAEREVGLRLNPSAAA